jgi:hypothetical protein
MQSATRRIAGGALGRRAHAVLISGQIALTLLLLTAAGGATEGFLRLMHTKLGYDPHNTMDVGIPIHTGSYVTWQARAAYFDQLRGKVAALPGVVSVANASDATPPVSGASERVEIMGRSAQEYNEVRLNLVGSEYFPLLHIALKQGRVWNRAETMRGAHLAAINERTRVAPLSVLHPVRAQIQSVDSDQEVDQFVPTLEELITIQPDWQRDHLVTMLFGSFAVLALALATFGLYSVVSYSAARRTNEFGIRMARGKATCFGMCFCRHPPPSGAECWPVSSWPPASMSC